MPTTVAAYWSNVRAIPVYRPSGVQGQSIKLPASINYYAGTILGEVTATPGTYKAYTAGAVDGSQHPSLVLEYSCSTDASGNITLAGDFAQVYQSAPALVLASATWRRQDLVGFDLNVLTSLGGAWIDGTYPTATVTGTWDGTTLTPGAAGLVAF